MSIDKTQIISSETQITVVEMGIPGPVGPQGPKGDTGDVTEELLAAKEAAEAAAERAEKAGGYSRSEADAIHKNIMSYSDANDFLPFKPKIGYFDDDCYANLYGSYNMSKQTSRNYYVTGDNKGREVLYYFANDGTDVTGRLFNAYRMTDAQGWIYNNAPCIPVHLSSSESINNMLAAGSEYLVYSTYHIENGTIKWYLVDTNGESNAEKWITVKEITNIITSNGTINGVVYFKEYGAISIVCSSGFNMYLVVYRYSDLSVIYPKTLLVNYLDIIDKSNFLNFNVSAQGCGSNATYNHLTEQLVIYTRCGGSCRTLNGNSDYFYWCLFLPFKVPQSIFQSGQGTIHLILEPLADYKAYSSVKGIWRADNNNISASYDNYKNVLYYAYTNQNNLSLIYRLKTNDRPLNTSFYYASAENIFTPMTPDVTPWAKGTDQPIYFSEGLLYFLGSSSKYGNKSVICTEYSNNVNQPDNYLNFKPNRFWISQIEGEDAKVRDARCITHIRETETKNRYIYYNGAIAQEIKIEDFTGNDGESYRGKRIIADLPEKTVPTLPSNYNYSLPMGYDVIRGKIYFLATDKVSADPARQGYYFLLVWNSSTNTFAEYRNLPDLDAYCTASKNAMGYVRLNLFSNMFIDLDGAVYFVPHYQYVGNDGGGEIFKIDLNATPVMKKQRMSVRGDSAGGRIRVLTYDNTMGYNIGLREDRTIATSKSLISGQPAKTKEQFFNGDTYVFRFNLASTVGLVAYLQSTPIFLGGYFSTVDARGITLNPNAENFIYLERDSVDRKKVNVLVSNKKIGGEKGFNRVLISKITTNASNITSQEDYPVAWNY